jgi:S1-C subfamily serine protease
MKHASRFVRTLVVLSALIGAAGFAGPKQEEPSSGSGPDSGVLVLKVEPRSPADKAGIARGDIILAVDGEDVATPRDVQKAIASKRPGDKVKVTVLHGDARRALAAELDERDGRTFLGVYFEPAALAQEQPPAPPGKRPAPDIRPQPRITPMPHILTRSGAQVISVAEGSPAEKAGLRKGDVITSVDGRTLEEKDDLADRIGAHKPGDTVTIEALWAGRELRELKVTLGENPNDRSKAWLGVEFRMAFRIEGNTPWTGRIPLALGVRVTDVTMGSPAAKAGIERGDLLTSIDGMSVLTAREVAAAIRGHKPGDTVKIGVARGTDREEVDLEVTLTPDPEDKMKAYLGVQLGGPWIIPGWPDGRGSGGRMPGGPGTSVPGGAVPGGTDA